MSRISSAADWLLKLPVIWGLLACLAFYAVLAPLNNALLDQYFGSPGDAELGNLIKLSITGMFCVGATALVMRLFGLASQLGVLHRAVLDPKPAGGQATEDTDILLGQLDDQPSYLKNTYLVRRLRLALEQVRRKDSADSLEEDLRRLEEADYDHLASGYAMTKIIVWAIPILGFLGTVIGITIAIGKLSPEALESSLDLVTAGLSVAFDTTAIALALSLVLTFMMFFVKSREEQVLVEVNERVIDELVGRFQQYGGATDPMAGSVLRMCNEVVRAVETLSARQIDLWAEAVSETHSQWANVTSATTDTIKQALTASLKESLTDHSTGLAAGIETQLQTLNQGLTDQNAAFTTALNDQVRILSEAVDQQVTRLDSGAENLLGNLKVGLERMAELLVEALQRHGETLTAAENDLASENRRHLSEVEAALGEAMVLSADRQEKLVGRSEELLREMQQGLICTAKATIEHQEQLVRQGEVLLSVVESTNQLSQLQDTLNNNLDSLGRSHNLEETLLSLSASIQLLSARTSSTVAVPANKAA